MMVPSVFFEDLSDSLKKFFVFIMAIESVFDFRTIFDGYSLDKILVFMLFLFVNFDVQSSIHQALFNRLFRFVFIFSKVIVHTDL